MFVRGLDLNLHVEMMGEGIPLICLHGYSVDSEIMKGFLEPVFATRTGWQRIYVDTPAHGRSDYPENIASSDEMLDIVLDAVCKLVADRPFVLAGLSYGGYLARAVAARLPEQVQGLLLVCPVIKQKDRELPQHEVLVDTMTVQPSEGFRKSAVIQTDRVWERYQQEVAPGVERFAKRLNETEFLTKNIAFSFEEALLQVPFDKPALIINGRQDSVVGYRDVWLMLESCPHASYAILDHAGHLVEIEQEKVVTALVEEWLDRVEWRNVRQNYLITNHHEA